MSDRTLGGKYRLTDQIGAKDGVKTYKAVDESGAVTAVELIPAPTPQDVTRLDRWAETMRGFDHPDLPRVFGYGADGESFYVVREYVVGTNLKTLLAGGPLSVDKAVHYAIQVSEALHAANRMGLVHGDLRPHNIVVTRDDHVKVTEFQMPPASSGIAPRTSAAPEFWHYASPEEAQGLQLAPTSDVYSLGVIMYEMVTGRVPFDGETVAEVQEQHLTKAPTPPRTLNIHVPAALDGIIMRALAKDPADRYQSFESMREDLWAVLAMPTEEIVRAPGRAPEIAPAAVPGVVTVPAYPVRRRRVWPWALLVALLVVALAAAVGASFLLAPIGVPDLAGLTRAEAQTVLVAAGLTLGATIDQPAATARIGTVIAQNPRVGVRVRGRPDRRHAGIHHGARAHGSDTGRGYSRDREGRTGGR
jgi:serine/threonine-protein kinase